MKLIGISSTSLNLLARTAGYFYMALHIPNFTYSFFLFITVGARAEENCGPQDENQGDRCCYPTSRKSGV